MQFYKWFFATQDPGGQREMRFAQVEKLSKALVRFDVFSYQP